MLCCAPKKTFYVYIYSIITMNINYKYIIEVLADILTEITTKHIVLCSQTQHN